jgi:hypothetical protein
VAPLLHGVRTRVRSILLGHSFCCAIKIYFGADGLLIYWAHKKNTLGGDHAATTQSSLAKAADWRTPLPGMRATDVSYVH